MKKIIFLLLCTVSIYAQTKTGNEQEFDYGIVNNAAQTVTSPNTIVTQGADGTYGKASVNNLPLSIAVLDSLSNVVHKTGNETIAGNKLFTNQVGVNDGADISFKSGSFKTSFTGSSTLTVNRGIELPNKDGVVALTSDLTVKENVSNKQNSLAVDGTGIKYPTVDAVNTGLATKIGGSGTSNYIPKFAASGTLGNSSIFENVAGNVSIGNNDPQVKLSVHGIEGNTTTPSNGIGKFIGGDHGLFIGSLAGTPSYAAWIQSMRETDGLVLPISINPNGGNVGIGTTIDDGVNKLQVNGSTKTTALNLTNTPTTSASTYDILTRNTITGVVEKVNTNIALTGTPTAPTATVGTNTTQIATTAFVMANSSPTPTLQQVVNLGNSVFDGSTKTLLFPFGTQVYDIGETTGTEYQKDRISGYGVNGLNELRFNKSIAGNNYYNFPNKAEGTYTLATIDDLALKFLDEGNGVGAVFGNQSRTFYGNIGLDAIDFSYSSVLSSVFGATGESSFAAGIDNISSGYGSTTFGYLNNNASIEGFSGGVNSQSVGYVNTTLGVGHNVTGTNITVIGQAANIIAESTASNNIGTSPVFVVGNGTITDGSDYVVATRSNALVVRKNGNTELNKLIVNNVIRLKNYTVATLPAGTQGDSAYVTDALAPTYLVAIVGGGSVVCPVFYNGSAWISH